MALTTCPHCGKQMFDRADVCPHCGEMTATKKQSIQKQKKKRLIIGIPLSIISLFAMFLSAGMFSEISYYALNNNGSLLDNWDGLLISLVALFISFALFCFRLVGKTKKYKTLAFLAYIVLYLLIGIIYYLTL